MLRVELPATLKALERASDSLEQLAGESAGRLVTLDALATEGEATMVAVRELAGSLNEIMRGPADTVSGVRRSARMMGDGLVHAVQCATPRQHDAAAPASRPRTWCCGS